MISFPWDNTSSTVLDRNVSSDTLAEKYFDMLAGGNSGIYAPVGAQGSVSPGTGMTVVVQPVEGVIEGRIYSETVARTLTIQASEAQDRIDTVVIRRNKADRVVDLYVVKGTAASTPVGPALTRSGDVYEVGIADLFIAATTTSITQQRITDTRSETARCQIVPVVGNIDTTSMFDQYQAALDAYLDLVQQAIDETLAGNLQSQIDASEAIIAKHDGNFAGAYSASSTYALNTFVIYANDLYKCTTAITVAEAWTAGHWTKVSVGAELSSLITNLNVVLSNRLSKTTLFTGTQVSFAPQNLNIDLSEYDYYEVLCYQSSAGGKTITSTGVIPIAFDSYANYNGSLGRAFTRTANSLYAEAGMSGAVVNNAVLPPHKVYGYKND